MTRNEGKIRREDNATYPMHDEIRIGELSEDGKSITYYTRRSYLEIADIYVKDCVPGMVGSTFLCVKDE
ncbi:hypothetical protein PMAYCL1PPCAC_08885 [Pristionchus mayeri]|uniref:Uncharacterized protein n=1 Tax=Pristionchus mayeri TaxID=1317129 RepID=A0AAN5CBV3_9BILA|nr:hypothetical protein PMAYCL1PPCAC_08885 [Pristionchus mayeri]